MTNPQLQNLCVISAVVSEALDGIVLHFQRLVLCSGSVEMLQWPNLTTSSAVSLVQYRPSMPQHGGQSGQADNAN